MGRTIFRQPIAFNRTAKDPGACRVTIGEESATWNEINRLAIRLSQTLMPARTYVVEPWSKIATFVALLAVTQTEDASLIWARATDLPLSTKPVGPSLFICGDDTTSRFGRPLYATPTSGTLGQRKIAFGCGDTLELVALQYEAALYQMAFEGAGPDTLATCLPLDYSATFMMLIVPALFFWKDIEIFAPHRWDRLVDRSRTTERLACLAVPSLLAAAAHSRRESLDMDKVLIFTTAGYLSRGRMEAVGERFRGVTLASSYGATETGVMTVDWAPDGVHFHVGRPIMGKPIWLMHPDENGLGRIATAGPDTRDFYLDQPEPLRALDGSVAVTDFGHFDERGNLYLDGRIDGGEKLHGLTVYPRRIERHLLSLKGVEDVRVTIQDGGAGTARIEARVVGSVSEADLWAHCEALPTQSRPMKLICVPEGSELYSSHGKL